MAAKSKKMKKAHTIIITIMGHFMTMITQYLIVISVRVMWKVELIHAKVTLEDQWFAIKEQFDKVMPPD